MADEEELQEIEVALGDGENDPDGQSSEEQASGEGEGDEGKQAKAPESELEQYSDRVQKRIKNLTTRYRNEERDKNEALRVGQELLVENERLKARINTLDSGYLTEYGARVDAQVSSAERQLAEAHESQDVSKIVEAQKALAKAVADQELYSRAKSRAPQQEEQQQRPLEAHAQAQPAQQQMQPIQPQQQPVPQPDPKAQAWAEKNDWFGQDEVMTYAAFGIHRKLIEEEGFDPAGDDYYGELDRRLREEFPQKFKAPEPKPGKRAQVAPAAASASRQPKQGRRTVTLTPSQVAIAKKLNVPLEEYAKYVKEDS